MIICLEVQKEYKKLKTPKLLILTILKLAEFSTLFAFKFLITFKASQGYRLL